MKTSKFLFHAKISGAGTGHVFEVRQLQPLASQIFFLGFLSLFLNEQVLAVPLASLPIDIEFLSSLRSARSFDERNVYWTKGTEPVLRLRKKKGNPIFSYQKSFPFQYYWEFCAFILCFALGFLRERIEIQKAQDKRRDRIPTLKRDF